MRRAATAGLVCIMSLRRALSDGVALTGILPAPRHLAALAADARAGLVARAARAATGAMHGVDTAAGPLSPQLLGATAAGAAVLRLPPGSAVPVLSSVALAAPFTMNSGGGDASHVLRLEAAGPHLMGLACPRFVEWRGSG